MQAQSIQIQNLTPSACVIRLRGEHDVSSREALSVALLAAGECKHVLVDLSQCDFIDSTLISTLLAAANQAQQRDGSVELVVPAEPNAVRRTLELANVQRVLPFHASCATAVETITVSV